MAKIANNWASARQAADTDIWGAELMLALERLFKIGPFYPPEHDSCQRVSAEFTAALKEFLTAEVSSIRFDVAQGTLLLQGQPLPEDLRGVPAFVQLLQCLGLAQLEIHQSVGHLDLYRFVKLMLTFRNQVSSAKQFQQVEFSGLPAAIRVVQREFVDGAKGRGDGGAAAEADLDPDAVNAVEAIIDQDKQPVVQGLDRLIDQLDSEENASLRSRAFDSVEIMIESLGSRDLEDTPFAATANEPARVKPAEIEYELSLDELRDRFREIAEQAGQPVLPAGADRCEQVTILMQMLRRDLSEAANERATSDFQVILTRELSREERAIAVAGVLDLLDLPEKPWLVRNLGLVCGSFRRSRSESVLVFLDDVLAACNPEQWVALWPHVVNELLLGPKGEDPALYSKLCRRMGEAAAEDKNRRTPVLKQLEAVGEDQVADKVLSPPLLDLFPVFHAILQMPHPGTMTRRLLEGLQANPPCRLSRDVLPLIDQYRHGFRPFLSLVLERQSRDDASDELEVAAGAIVAELLPALPRARRDETWVPATIRTVSDLPVADAEQILRQILSERRWLVLRAWPRPCRHAAEVVLGELRERRETAN